MDQESVLTFDIPLLCQLWGGPHQTERVDLPVRLAASFAERFKETFPVHVLTKDRLPPIAAIHTWSIASSHSLRNARGLTPL